MKKSVKISYITFSLLLMLLFLALGQIYFHVSYLRLKEAFSDLWSSARIYFFEVFSTTHIIVPTVTEKSEIMNGISLFPKTLTGFKEVIFSYFNLLQDKENLIAYGMAVCKILLSFLKLLFVLLPFILIPIVICKIFGGKENNKHGKDTLPLKIFKLLSGRTYHAVKSFVLGYISFFKKSRALTVLTVILWSVNLNLLSIVTELFAYCLYFAGTFNFDTLQMQLFKLLTDLQIVIYAFPWWVFLPILFYRFKRLCRRIALNKLMHLEARNCGFINELPIVSMAVGSMGKKKTTLITDMALSQEVMFRQKALELLQGNDMRFPFFPWISFETEIRSCMESGTVYNLASTKEWVQKKKELFENSEEKRDVLYGYDYLRYGLTYDDGLRVWQLFEVLSAYAQLYFIYVIESSLIVSNYSIREDNLLLDGGNFPIWISDFFPRETAVGGRHAHILDFDVLRLGKKVMENNPSAGSFEFGVVVISEVGKERGNNLDHKEMKKGSEETNQKNDLFNSWLKMCRHSATVDNFPFIKVFTDEQRPESLGADARELADIVHIVSSGKQRLALPFYTVEEMLTEWVFNKFISVYTDYRFFRGDNTLFMHIFKCIAAWLYKRQRRIYNMYGYSVSVIEKERGTQDGKREKKKYFILNKKIYASRFSTDCFSDYFNDMAKKTKIGISDYMEYETERASVQELKMQNSYFINALYKNAGSD